MDEREASPERVRAAWQAPIDLDPEKRAAIMFGHMAWMNAGVAAMLWKLLDAGEDPNVDGVV